MLTLDTIQVESFPEYSMAGTIYIQVDSNALGSDRLIKAAKSFNYFVLPKTPGPSEHGKSQDQVIVSGQDTIETRDGALKATPSLVWRRLVDLKE
jgi:hypothetical protein